MNNNITITLLVVLLILSFLGINVLLFTGNVIDDVFIVLQNILNIVVYFFKKILTDFGFISGTVINDSSDIISNTAKGGIDVANGVVHDVGNILIKTRDKDGKTEPPVPIRTINTNQLLSDLSNVRLGQLPDYNIPDLSSIVLNDIPNPALPGLNNIKIPDLDDIAKKLTPFDFVLDSTVRITPPADCKQCIKTTTGTSDSPEVTAVPANNNNPGWCFVGKDDNKRICAEMKTGDTCASNAVFQDKDTCTKG
jgi:hypothetical protein